MTEHLCASCHTPVKAADLSRHISAPMCKGCLATLAAGASPEKCREILHGIGAPVLLLQSNPRQVYAANDAALALFGREPHEAEGHRGGEVFGCIHSFTVAGCGKDVNCNDCRIKASIVDTFGGTNATGISAILVIRRDADALYTLTISTEPVGAYPLVRIDRFEKQAQVS